MRVSGGNAGGRRVIRRVLPGMGIALAMAGRQAGAAVQPPTLADADKHWKQHSYARALTEYEALQKAGRVPAVRRDEVAYRVAVLPGKTEQWNRALADGLDFVKAHRGTIWEARGLYWLGRLYVSVPHQGWRVSTRTFRGENVPKSEGDAKPVSVDVTVRDQRNALDALEAAHILYARQTAGQSYEAAKTKLVEQAHLDFDLISLLQQDPNFPAWAQQMRWLPPNDASWEVDAGASYDPAWPQPKKILFLYQFLIHTDPTLDSAAHHTSALAYWSEALWLRRYQALMRGWAVKVENGKQVHVPYPYQAYQDLRPASTLAHLVKSFSEDTELCHQAQILMARWRAQDGDLTGSVRAYRQFLAQRPRSKWAGDARAQIAALLSPSVYINSLAATRPGHAPRLGIGYRNVQKVHFDAYRIDLPALLIRRHDTPDNGNWGDLDGLIGSEDTSSGSDQTLIDRYKDKHKRTAKRRRRTPSLLERLAAVGARRVTSWDVQTANRGDLKPRSQNITAPLGAAGAYVIVASVPGQRYGLLLPVSDLVLAQKRERGSSLFYVADAEAGRPQPGVRIVAKLLWHKSRQEESRKSPVETWGARVTNTVSGADGVTTVPLQYEPNADNTRVAAIAWTGQRFALIGPQYVDCAPNEGTPLPYKGYTTTDRAVYRPRQTVQFRQLLMRRDPGTPTRRGELRPLAGRLARVYVNDPQGNVIFKQQLRCSAWGNVSGCFVLPDHAPLGEYSIDVTVPYEATDAGKKDKWDANEPLDNAGNRFRVEEYKKPEFEVTVTPGAERVRLGQTGRMKIHAAYYFGGPVPGAGVSYRVYRNVYAASYRFPEPYDYLYHTDDNRGGSDTDYRGGEVVAQGRARLDAHGDTFVTFETRADGPRWQNNDLSYTVEADVQDQSRRVISGTGALKATRHDVAVFLRFPHGYATQGDRVDVEVKTLNPSDQPVSVEGVARVYRQPNQPDTMGADVPAVGLRHGETLVWSQPLHTDAQGYAQIAWKANTSGYFRVAFETQDADTTATAAGPGPGAANGRDSTKDSNKANSRDNLVGGDTLVWVDGPELRSRRFLFQGVTLAVQNPYYQEGQTANALLVTPEPGCTVLLTREVGGRILDRRVVLVPGRSLQIPVSVTSRDVPNVFLSALMIRHGEMFEAAQELFVPPVRQSARVTITPDKAKYAPGEKARLQITACDYRGRPLRAELSVGVSDAALAYIQKDYAPDIRAYFYGDRREQNIQNEGSPQTTFTAMSESVGPVTTYPYYPLTPPGGMGQIPAALLSDNYFGMQNADGFTVDTLSNVIATRDGNMYFNGSGVYHSQTAMGGRQLARGISLRNGNAALDMGSVDVRSINGSTNYAKYSSATEAAVPARPASVARMRVNIAESTLSMPRSDLSSRIAQRKTLSAPDELASATIRSDFRDTAFWTPNVVTDAQGRASVTVTWPDNLTQWRANVIGSTQAAQVGVAEARVTTKKDLLVQLESPRFVVERDVVTLSAVVHNDTPNAQRVRVRLDLDNADVVAEDLAVAPAAPVVRLAGYGKEEEKRLRGEEERGGQVTSASVQGGGRLRVRTSETWVMIASGGQQRVDWLARPQHEGVMHARMTAQSQTDADAAQTLIPVLVHGVERTVVQSGALKTANTAQLTIELPAQRKAGSSQLVVTLNPSLAGVMLDALPYLADYPYGCVEQTLSRFVPSVLVARSLKASGYDLADLERAARRHGNSSLKAVTVKGMQTPMTANSAYTYPNAQAGQAGSGHQEIDGIGERWRNPVFSQSELNKMVRDGLARLKDMQHSDGGWGWWKDDISDAYMTTNVLYGLLRAEGAGVVVDADERTNGLKYLRARYLAETDLQQMAYQARVMALAPSERDAIRNRVEKRLYAQRDKLSAYGKALLALALHDLGQNGQARVVLDNLENTVHLDALNGTAYWDDINNQWWRWYNNKIETNATVLEAYTAIAPNASLPAQLVKWLVNNRKGASWHDTRDTALTVGALAEWARVHKELSPDYTLTVDLGGRIRRTYHITHQNALWNDNTFVVPDALLQTGPQTLSITRQGTGTCYYAATTRTFSQEEPIAATGNEIHVTRRYFRLIANTASGTEQPDRGTANMSVSGRSEQGTEGKIVAGAVSSMAVSSLSSVSNPFLTGQYEMLEQGGEQVNGEETVQGPQYERVELRPGEMLDSGDLLEVELALEAQNDYDYVLFEDMKPAGCEPVELRSGGHQGLGVYSNMELRDEKVAFFLTSLGQGRRVLSYRLRAETPGAFHVLPTNGYAMYAPDVRAISDEARVNIRDAEPAETARTSASP